MDLPLENRLLGPYRLVRKLGAGGFAPVWLANEQHGGKTLRDVAVKLFLPPANKGVDEAAAAIARDQVIEEARSLSRVEHPAIVRFYSLQQDTTTGLIGLVMEYVPGHSVAERLTRDGPLDEKTVVEIATNVAWALAAVHDAGLVHRDIKPANVVESATGFRLIDFGIATTQRNIEYEETIEIGEGSGQGSLVSPARQGAPSVSSKEKVLGTPGYIAPEYLTQQSPATAASDLYGLGAMIFKLLTTRVPAAAAVPVDQQKNPNARFAYPVLMGVQPAPRLDAVMNRPVLPALADLTALLLSAKPRERPQHADWVAREFEKIREMLVPTMAPPRASSPGITTDLVSTQQYDERHEKKTIVVRTFEARPPFVGRQDERARIERAASDARNGGVRFVLISGALGMGRSRLLDVACEEHTRGFPVVLRLHASPERRGPLRPWIRALEQLQTHPSFVTMVHVQSAIERALAPQTLGAANDLDQALEGVEDALLAASRTTPLVIAFDDLQWADAHSLTLLRLLLERAENPGSSRLLILAAVRNEPNAPAHLKAFLRRARMAKDICRIPLEAFSTNEAIEFTQSICPMTPDLQQALLRVSGQVPFFMVHALRAWHERGSVVLDPRPGGGVMARLRDERVLAEDVPGVGDFIEARLGSLFEADSNDERAALRTLAAIALYGGGLTFERIEAATKIDAEHLESLLDTLLGASILSVDGERQEYTFAQEMVRQALLNSTRQKPWFTRLFRALLDVLATGAEENRDAAFLARGYDKLGVPDAARKWLSRAMDHAFALGLFDDAIEFGERRIALESDSEERLGIELNISMALLHARRLEAVRARFEKMEHENHSMQTSARGRRLALQRRMCRLFLARGLQIQGVMDETLIRDADTFNDPLLAAEARMAVAGLLKQQEAWDWASQAIAILAGKNNALEFRARMLRAEIHQFMGNPDYALMEEDLSCASAIAKAIGSSWQQLDVENDWAFFEAETGRLEQAIARYRRNIQKAEELGMMGHRRLMLTNLSACLLRAEMVSDALETTELAWRLSKEHGDPQLLVLAISLRADALFRSGALHEALAMANEALELQRQGPPRSLCITLLRRVQILEALGREEEASKDAREVLQIAEKHEIQDVAVGALLWERTRQAAAGQIPASELAECVAMAKTSNLKLRPLALRFLARAENWLANAGV